MNLHASIIRFITSYYFKVQADHEFGIQLTNYIANSNAVEINGSKIYNLLLIITHNIYLCTLAENHERIKIS